LHIVGEVLQKHIKQVLLDNGAEHETCPDSKVMFRSLDVAMRTAACKCALIILYSTHSVKLDEWTCLVAKGKCKGSSTYIWPPHNLRRIREFMRESDALASICMPAEASHN